MRSLGNPMIYLDIDDYRSAVDIYYVEASDDAEPTTVEKDVQFTYMRELCQYIEKKYKNAYYIVPDKFYSHTPQDHRYFALSHATRMDDRELHKILQFRSAEVDRMKHENERRPRFPHHYYDPVGYQHPYKPIPRDQPPIAN